MPSIKEAKLLKPVTETRGLYMCKQDMPWPLWPRDMVMTATGMFDKENLGCLCVIKSPPEGSTFFGSEIPTTAEGHVRIILNRGYHYF